MDENQTLRNKKGLPLSRTARFAAMPLVRGTLARIAQARGNAVNRQVNAAPQPSVRIARTVTLQ